MANNVRILVSAKDEASGPIDRLKDKFGMLREEGAKGFGVGVGAALTTKALGLVDTAISSTINWLAEGVKGAREEEAGIARLGQSLRANVKDWDGNSDAIERRVRAAAQLGFADDDVRDSLARLVAVTHDVDKAFEVQRTAMDLARFKGVDLATATQALIKVEGGQYRALKEMGIVLKEGATQTEALAAVQKVAQGQAASYMETTAGKSELLGQKIDDLGERIGGVLIPALDEATTGAINFLDALDADSPMTLDKRLKTVVDTLNTFNPLAWGYVDFQGQMEEAQRRNAAATEGMIGPMGDAVDKLGDLRSGARKTADAADTATGKVKGLGGAAQKAADRFADLKSNVDDAAKAIAEAAYGPEELRLEFGKVQLELKDNKDELADVEKKIQSLKDKGKPVPRELRERFLDLRLAVNDNKQSIIETGLKLEAVGGIKMTALQKQFQNAGIDLSRLSGEAQDLWWYLVHASQVSFSDIVSGGGKGGKAAGGYIPPYGMSVVGEGVNRAEIVHTGPAGAWVNPSAAAGMAGATGAGSPIIIQLVADGRKLAEVVAPGVTSWQQRRGT